MEIDWVTKKIQIAALHLKNLLSPIQSSLQVFEFVSFAHVYRELNSEVDVLLKLTIVG